MKKIYNYVMLAAVAAAALVSCAKEKEMDKPEVAPASEGIKVSLKADAVTKTYIEGVTPKWKGTDAVGVFTGTNTTNAQFTNTQADGEAAIFNGSVPAAGTYYAYYPYSTGGANDTGALVQIPSEQHPTPTSFDGAADILVSESFEVSTTDETPINVKFRRLGSFLKFTFVDETTGSVLAGLHATKVSVIVDNGDFRPCPSVRVTPEGLGTRGAGMKTVKALYDDDVYELTADGKATYIGILPQTFAIGASFDVTITTSKFDLKKTLVLDKAIELRGGQILPITVKIKNADIPVTVTKLWDKISGDTANGITGSWMASLTDGVVTGNAQGDRNVAIDGENVYVAEFNNSKNIWAISIANPSIVKRLPTTSVKSEGLSDNYLSCVRSVRNTNPSYNGGKDIVIATNLMSGGNNTLYIYDNGIDAEPRVVEMLNCAGRLGDTFTTYGDYGHCMLTFGKHNGNGFVHFVLPTTGTSTSLQNRYQITIGGENTNTQNFPAFYPIPGDITKGVYAQRGEARAMWAEASTDEETVWSAWDTAWGTPAVKLHYGIGGDATNGNGFAVGYNFLEFNGKRYVIYGRISSLGSCELIIREGAMSDAWTTILGLDGVAEPKPRIFYEKIVTKNDSYLSGNSGLDVAVYKKSETEAYIAIDKQNVGLTVYKMSLE